MPQATKQTVFSKALDSVTNFLGSFNKQQKAISYAPNIGYGSYTGVPTTYDFKNGAKKPSNVTFAFLRRIAKHDAVIRICINVLKKEVSQSDYEFVTKSGQPVSDSAAVQRLEDLFNNVNVNGENIRVFWDKLLEDLLVLDAGVVEKVYNAKGELVEMVVVDGSTIRPVFNEYGEMDPNRAYVQVVNEKVLAEFKLSEIMYMMQSPQNDVRNYGYGLSPIESILLQVQASLQADLYNANTFAKDNVPPGLLDLGDMNNEEAKAFISEWNATVINDTQKLKFVWGTGKNGAMASGKRYIPFQQNNKDMQFVEYVDWLSRLKLAVYGLSSLDANITADVNRATSKTQQAISASRGVMSVKRLIEEYFNREIIRTMGIEDIEFRFKRIVNLEDKQVQANIDKVYLDAGVVSPSFIADREGFDEIDAFLDEDLDYKELVAGNEKDQAPPEVPVQEVPPTKVTKPAKGTKNNATDAKTPITQGKSKKVSKYFRPLYK